MTDQPPDYPPPPPGGGYGYTPPPPPPPGYGYPPPTPGGYGYSPGYPTPPPQGAGTNGFAIASLVCSVVGLACMGFGSFLGVIFGIIALNQIKKTGQGGHGLALAGVITGGIVTAFWVVLLVVGGIAGTFGHHDNDNNRYHHHRYGSSAAIALVHEQPTSPGLITCH
jgi:hypothetical protein